MADRRYTVTDLRENLGSIIREVINVGPSVIYKQSTPFMVVDLYRNGGTAPGLSVQGSSWLVCSLCRGSFYPRVSEGMVNIVCDSCAEEQEKRPVHPPVTLVDISVVTGIAQEVIVACNSCGDVRGAAAIEYFLDLLNERQ